MSGFANATAGPYEERYRPAAKGLLTVAGFAAFVALGWAMPSSVTSVLTLLTAAVARFAPGIPVVDLG